MRAAPALRAARSALLRWAPLTGALVDPDGSTAREWARRELADPAYREQRNWFAWLLDRLGDLLRTTVESVDGNTVVLAIVALLLIVAGCIAVRVAGPTRRTRARRGATVAVFEDDRRTAEQLRHAADEAARAGAWDTAVLERFRALVRGLEERLVLDEAPGRTAREAAHAAARAFPGREHELAAAAELFDGVRYGGRPATAGDEAGLRSLDEALDRTRPLVAAP